MTCDQIFDLSSCELKDHLIALEIELKNIAYLLDREGQEEASGRAHAASFEIHELFNDWNPDKNWKSARLPLPELTLGTKDVVAKEIVAYGRRFAVGMQIVGLTRHPKDYWCGHIDGFYITHIPEGYFRRE